MSGVGIMKTNQYSMMNMKYKNKYKRLKRIIKNYVFENAALCDQIAQIQDNISIIKEERQFLLKKLLDYEDAEIQMLSTTAVNNPAVQHNTIPGKRGPKKRLSLDTNTTKNKTSNTTNINKTTTSSTTNISTTTIKKQNIQPTLITDGQGRPIFPINLDNSLVIHSIGEVVPENVNFHSEKWIYPIGYTSTRIYSHPREPERKCTFTCKILDNSGTPQFQIIPDSDYDHVFFGESANICHLGLLETIVRTSDVKNLPIRAQGEIFFGLSNKTVRTLLQASINLRKCINFNGFLPDSAFGDEEKDPTLNYDALQKLMANSVYHTVPEIKAEPPDELLE